jgi:RNA polymerase sigma factor (sigma-70 family)
MATAAEELTMANEAEERARFAAILAEHGPGLRRVARAYAARTDETDDLVQEIALAIWRALPSFRGECSPRTFVFRVAHNRGLTFSDRTRGNVAAPTREPPEEDALRSLQPTPEEELADNRRRALLWAAIRELAPGARAVLTLALEGLSHEEIAQVLGISANAVAVRLTRARGDMKKKLEGGAR